MNQILQSPSPNFSGSTYEKIGVMIHKTLGSMPSTLDWLRNPAAQVSSHYLVAKEGPIHQLVQLNKRPWSAGRITTRSLSDRAKQIMLKTPSGSYVKPGHYLVQIEVECLEYETYTNKQYKDIVQICNSLPYDVTEMNLLTHKDTASDKPNLDTERTEILRLLNPTTEKNELVLERWTQLRIRFENKKIILFSKDS